MAAQLARRNMINDGEEVKPPSVKVSVYTEFPEFSRKEIKELEPVSNRHVPTLFRYEKQFKTYDTSKDGYLDLMELKYMMEQLDAAQTHVALKAMIAEIDEDNDGQISFREFLLIFRKVRATRRPPQSRRTQAARGELKAEGLTKLATQVNVAEVGTKGAKDFFEAKAAEVAKGSKFEAEIKVRPRCGNTCSRRAGRAGGQAQGGRGGQGAQGGVQGEAGQLQVAAAARVVLCMQFWHAARCCTEPAVSPSSAPRRPPRPLTPSPACWRSRIRLLRRSRPRSM